ncbi:hypothetical protein MUK42_33386 [Musa troglodytarum]|uniref:Uncharacterized protein n=1 Tax=Musa troglodytarum TaxID=320322 RepID=A0A9E7H5Q3_9LILI|nr:hypothetical protein MUK42_33386 [Musa troglodytarum]
MDCGHCGRGRCGQQRRKGSWPRLDRYFPFSLLMSS